MKNLIVVLAIFVSFMYPVSAQNLASRWQYEWGGNNRDYPANILPLPHHRFLLGATSVSAPFCNKSSASYGGEDMVLYVLDDLGNKVWEKSYGGASLDMLSEVKPVAAGGFIMVGGTLSGISGNKTTGNFGSMDIWLVRVDDNGNVLWEKTLGTNRYEIGRKIIETDDGGFIVGGISAQGLGANLYQSPDYFVMKLDASGNQQWSYTYGGARDEELYDMRRMANGDYILSGLSNSVPGGNKTAPALGVQDHWVICINASGRLLWDKSYGGANEEGGGYLLPLQDGNYLLSGSSASGGSGVLYKIDTRGNQLWTRACNDGIYRMTTQADNGIIYVAGESYKGIQGCKASPLAGGNPDYWIVSYDANGNKLEDWDFGGNADDYIISDILAIGDDVWVMGQTNSPLSGNKTVALCGGRDAWLIRISRKLFVQQPTPDDICDNTSNINVHFGVYTNHLPGNVFTAQLSDANGSFNTYTSIGTLTGTTAGVIPAVLPANLVVSDRYKIRVVATLPVDTSNRYAIAIQQGPKVMLGNDTTICISNMPYTLNAGNQPTGSHYLWSDGSTGKTITVSTQGTYACTVQHTCGNANGSINISTKDIPIATPVTNPQFCEGTTATLQFTPQPADVTYLWSTGATTPTIDINMGGTYSLRTTNACGYSDHNITMVMNPTPVTGFASDTVLCAGATLALTAPSGHAAYLWYDAAAGETRTINEAGKYWVQVTGANGCITRDTTTVQYALPIPTYFLPADTIICSYDHLVLKPAFNFAHYTWSTGTTLSSLMVEQAGTYWLLGTDRYGCTGKDSITISTNDCPYGFFMPTAFSPNRDGKNDSCRPTLYGRVLKYHFTIYNRWGQKVYDSHTATHGWDGFVNGQPAPPGMYVWTCAYQLHLGGEQRAKGVVMLVR